MFYKIMFIFFVATCNNFIVSCESKDYLGLFLFGASVEIAMKTQILRAVYEKKQKKVDVATSIDDELAQRVILSTTKSLPDNILNISLQNLLTAVDDIKVEKSTSVQLNSSNQSDDCLHRQDKKEAPVDEELSWSDIYNHFG